MFESNILVKSLDTFFIRLISKFLATFLKSSMSSDLKSFPFENNSIISFGPDGQSDEIIDKPKN